MNFCEVSPLWPPIWLMDWEVCVLVGGSSEGWRPSVRNGSKSTDDQDLEHPGSSLRS